MMYLCPNQGLGVVCSADLFISTPPSIGSAESRIQAAVAGDGRNTLIIASMISRVSTHEAEKLQVSVLVLDRVSQFTSQMRRVK